LNEKKLVKLGLFAKLSKNVTKIEIFMIEKSLEQEI